LSLEAIIKIDPAILARLYGFYKATYKTRHARLRNQSGFLYALFYPSLHKSIYTPQKFSKFFLLQPCQNCNFHTVSYRGANFVFPRARSPPPFLGTGNHPKPRKESGGMVTAICPDKRGKNKVGNVIQKNIFQFLSLHIAKIAFSIRLVIEGIFTPLPFAVSERRTSYMKHKSHETFVQQTFDSFCKKVLKYSARDYRREMKRLQERETPFSQLSARELSGLAVYDEYFKDAYAFDVLGLTVNVSDCELAEALNELPAQQREIVLMSYFFDMTDREIAERLNMARRTVAYKRTSTLRELKNLLESEE